jgi:hypothetical protein
MPGGNDCELRSFFASELGELPSLIVYQVALLRKELPLRIWALAFQHIPYLSVEEYQRIVDSVSTTHCFIGGQSNESTYDAMMPVL